jgi:hypothetical protein
MSQNQGPRMLPRFWRHLRVSCFAFSICYGSSGRRKPFISAGMKHLDQACRVRYKTLIFEWLNENPNRRRQAMPVCSHVEIETCLRVEKQSWRGEPAIVLKLLTAVQEKLNQIISAT